MHKPGDADVDEIFQKDPGAKTCSLAVKVPAIPIRAAGLNSQSGSCLWCPANAEPRRK